MSIYINKHTKEKRIPAVRLDGYNATFQDTTVAINVRYEDEKEIIYEITDLTTSVTLIFSVHKKKRPSS